MILHDMGHEILVVDTSEERVQKMLPYATNGLVADSTDKSSSNLWGFLILIFAW